MKKVFTLCLVLFTTVSLEAQTDKPATKKITYYVGPQASIAAADLAKTHSAGVGIHGQVLRSVSSNTAIGIRASYMYLFGKKFKSEVYEPGVSYGTEGKYKGMSDLGIGASIRHNLDDNCYFGFDLGACFDFGGGESHTGGMAAGEFGLLLNGDQGLALFMAICGDPEIQIGVRYSIRL